jgi:hypothetical protein
MTKSKLKIDMHSHILPGVMPNWTNKFGYGDFAGKRIFQKN